MTDYSKKKVDYLQIGYPQPLCYFKSPRWRNSLHVYIYWAKEYLYAGSYHL